jgi:hypothetical protein
MVKSFITILAFLAVNLNFDSSIFRNGYSISEHFISSFHSRRGVGVFTS